MFAWMPHWLVVTLECFAAFITLNLIRAWLNAPVIRHNRFLIAQMEKKTMTVLDDVKQSIADLTTSVATELQAISDKIASLQTGGNGATDADLTDLKSRIDGVKSTIDGETAALSAPPSP